MTASNSNRDATRKREEQKLAVLAA